MEIGSYREVAPWFAEQARKVGLELTAKQMERAMRGLAEVMESVSGKRCEVRLGEGLGMRCRRDGKTVVFELIAYRN